MHPAKSFSAVSTTVAQYELQDHNVKTTVVIFHNHIAAYNSKTHTDRLPLCTGEDILCQQQHLFTEPSSVPHSSVCQSVNLLPQSLAPPLFQSY